LPLDGDERVIEEWSANHFLRGEARGGKLLLTDVTDLACEGERFLLVDTGAGQEWLVLPSPRDVAARIRPSLAPRAE
jgi:hypothetical protein